MFHHKSSMWRLESEMIEKCQRELQRIDPRANPIQHLRLSCLSRGISGFLALGRLLRRMADDGKTHLNEEDLIYALEETGLGLTHNEARNLFNKFVEDDSGSVNITEFLIHVRPPISELRKEKVTEAFEKMDKSGDGVITIDDLKHVCSVKSNTRYISGEDSQESILKPFLANFEQDATRDGQITYEEFLDYYSVISASIDDDCYFDLMMRQDYNL